MNDTPTDTVTARARRPRSPAMFADLLPGVGATFETVAGSRGWLTVRFTRDLTDDETAAVIARLESTDDADMADRALLRELAAVVAPMDPTPMRTLLLRLTDRVLDA